jgi:prepilin signal peptidase PulO-like enzyme (type II secretory pathway)
LSHCFGRAFGTWSWNVSCNCSLSAIWTHRASRVLVIRCKIMIKFCMWFQHTLASLVLFSAIIVAVFLSFDQMHILAWILLGLALVIKTIIDIAIVQSLAVHASLSAIRITDEHSDVLRSYVVITHIGHSERNVAVVVSLGIGA